MNIILQNNMYWGYFQHIKIKIIAADVLACYFYPTVFIPYYASLTCLLHVVLLLLVHETGIIQITEIRYIVETDWQET